MGGGEGFEPAQRRVVGALTRGGGGVFHGAAGLFGLGDARGEGAPAVGTVARRLGAQGGGALCFRFGQSLLRGGKITFGGIPGRAGGLGRGTGLRRFLLGRRKEPGRLAMFGQRFAQGIQAGAGGLCGEPGGLELLRLGGDIFGMAFGGGMCRLGRLEPGAAFFHRLGRLPGMQLAPGSLALGKGRVQRLRRCSETVAPLGQRFHPVERGAPWAALARIAVLAGGKIVEFGAASGQRHVHAPPAGHLLDLFADRSHQIAPCLERQLLLLGGAACQLGHALPHPDQPRRPAPVTAQKFGDPGLGLIGLGDQRAVAVHRRGGLAKPAFEQGEAPRLGLDRDADLGRSAGMGPQRGDLLVTRAMRFEKQRLYRVEQRGFTVFIRCTEQVEPVVDGIDRHRIGETADIVDGDGAELHCASSRT